MRLNVRTVIEQEAQYAITPFSPNSVARLGLVLFLAIFCGFLSTLPLRASVSNVYVAQSAQGAASGADCADADPVSFFNTAGNWGIGATQIGSGTIVHLCGTFTGSAASTILQVKGSGSSGSPITLLFESGASLQAPYCSSAGCLDLNGKSNLVVDGGTTCGETSHWTTTPCNGLIQHTLAGSTGLTCPGGACSPVSGSINSTGIGTNSGSPTNIEIRNLKMALYVRSASDKTDSGMGMYGVGFFGGTLAQGIVVHNCIFTGVAKAVLVSLGTASGTLSNYQMYNSNISDQCWAMGIGANATSMNITGLLFHDNEVSNWDNWAPANTTGNVCHTNGTMWFNGDGATIHSGSGFIGDAASMIYDNYLHGNLAGNAPLTSPSGYLSCQDNCINISVFNNIVIDTSTGTTGGGCIYFNGAGGGGQQVYNNTMVRNNGGSCLVATGTTANVVFENNISSGCSAVIEIRPNTPSVVTSDYNVGYNITGAWEVFNSANSGAFLSLASFQTTYVQDTHSSAGNPNLGTTYSLLLGSAAIGRGTNLTSLGISLLDSDQAGVSRPASSVWDAGALQYVGSATGLKATPF